MNKQCGFYFIALLFACPVFVQSQTDTIRLHKAPAPLFRDPIYDGAADPVVTYNKAKKEWWMFYTQRRANVQVANVGWCYGIAIGVAVSSKVIFFILCIPEGNAF